MSETGHGALHGLAWRLSYGMNCFNLHNNIGIRGEGFVKASSVQFQQDLAGSKQVDAFSNSNGRVINDILTPMWSVCPIQLFMATKTERRISRTNIRII